MSHQSTHHHVLLNSIPRTHHRHHHQPNIVSIKPENDSDDDDVVFLSSVPKIKHTPEEYDPECQCSTCQLVRRLMAECTCEECRGQQTNQVNQTEGQVVEYNENVSIANAVSPTNGQPSSSSIQNNDASTSEHTNANDLDDDRSRSSTPDYLPRFFDDESGDSSSDDSEDDSGDCDVHNGNYAYHNMEIESLNSIVVSQTSISYQNSSVTNGNEFNSNDNVSTYLDDESTDSSPVKCPKCVKTFTGRKLLRHYRRVHQEWKPFYCRWSKCKFVATEGDIVVTHAYLKHFKSQNRQKARKCVAKREETQPYDPVLEKLVMKFVREKKISSRKLCSLCGRNLLSKHIKQHIRTHTNSGYRCAWPNCGFFYSQRKEGKKHLLRDHFKGKLVNSTQISEHLVEVDPSLANSNGLYDTIQNNDTSTSEHTNANDLDDDDHSRSSTPDYLPRFFDDESGDSSSDDSEDGDSVYSLVDQKSESEDNASVDDNDSSDNDSANLDDEEKDPTSVKCPKCAKAFTEKYKLLRHYRCIHLQWKPYYCRWPKCKFVAAEDNIVVTHANRKHFKSQNRQKARKCVGKQDETPPNDPVLEQIVAIKFVHEKKQRTVTICVCPRCGRNLSFSQLQSHIRTHANPGYRCTWPNCGFFYSHLTIASEHLSSDHLHVEKANSEQTHQYLVKVNPKTNKTTKVTSQLRSQREVDHHDKAGDEEDSNLDNDDADNSSIKPTATFNSNCPKCGRNFCAKGQFTQHFRTHANIGFCCAKCGAFYSQFPFAKKHLLMEHFKGKLVNATKINEFIIKVDPNKPKSNELHDSIQNNYTSTSEHTNANDQHDDDCSRSSTPDYLPRFFDDESGDSSSDVSEDDDDSVDDGDEMKLVQESEHEEDNDNRDPNYTFNDSSSVDSENDASVDDGDYSFDNMEIDEESESHNSNVHSQPSTSCQNAIVTNVDKSNLIENESTNSDDEGTDLTPDKCPKCAKTFPDIHKLHRHYRGVHQEWKPYYCRWPKCNFTSAIDFFVLQHVYRTHFKSQNRQKAKKYVGKRDETPPKDPVLEQIVANKFGSKKEMLNKRIFILNSNFNSNCPKCGRNFRNGGQFTQHLRSHTKSGFRCTFLKCGFFFCKYELAREHILKEHLKGRLVNSTQLNEHLIKVDPDLSSSNRLQNNDASTSDLHTNANDLDDVRKRCSPPDCMPRLFDDESKDSPSDDSDDDDSVDKKYDGDDTDHNMEIESESEDDNDNRDPDYAFTDFQMINSDDSEDDDSVEDATEHSQLSTSSSVSSDSSDNESTNLNSTETGSNGPTPIKCPKCEKTFTQKSVLLNHYRGVHQEWKPYFCRWPNCNFTYALDYVVTTHADKVHFNSQNRQIAKTFVGKREEAPPKDPVLEQIDGIKFRKQGFGKTKSICPRCGRRFYSEHLKSHIRTHAKPGYRCMWPNCTFFFSQITDAKKHVRVDHLQVEQANSTQTNQYLVKVNPKTNKTTKITSQLRCQREEDHHDNAGNEKDSNLDNDDAGNSIIKPTSTFNFNCPKCDRNFRAKGQFTQHFRTHANIGFLCTKCGAFYSHSAFARKHLLMEHFKGKLVNATKINEFIIKVDPNKPKSNELHDSIQNNDTSTSEHINANDLDDDRSRSSTPDYLPRFFDDESGDSSSDDSEDDDSLDDKNDNEFDKESESEEDNDKSDPDYTFKDSSSNDSEDDFGDDDADRNMEVDKEYGSLNSIVHSQPSTSYKNISLTNGNNSNSSDNELTNSNVEGTNPTPVKCPKCTKTFAEKHQLLRHYRWVHQKWKPYYCRWPQCNFVGALNEIVFQHTFRIHFNSQNRREARKYLGKRDETPPKDSIQEQIGKTKFSSEKKRICPQCRRKLFSQNFKRHVRSHASPGIRCTWPNCGFFYSQLFYAKKHLCVDHLHVEQANSQQIHQHLVKVDPKIAKTTKIRQDKIRRQRENGNDDDSSRSSAPYYLPRFFDDERGDSCSDDSEEDDSVDDGDDEDYIEIGKRKETPLKDPVPEQIVTNKFGSKKEMLNQRIFILNSTFNSNCPKCGRNFRNGGQFTQHLRSHTKSGFRCAWLKCGFFFCKYEHARKHVLKEHLKGRLVNSTQLNEHLIKVDPDLSSSNRLQNNDASTSEHTNANDLDDDHSRSSPPDYLPRLFDDESKDSRSDDSEDGDSVDDGDDGDHTDHNMEIESESEEDNDNRDLDYAFTDFRMINSDDSEDDDSVDDATEHSHLSTSSSVSSDSSDNESTDLNSTETGSNNGPTPIKCPKCERTFTQKSVLLRHYRGVHQEWKPYYCRWPKCTYTSAVGNIVVTHADNAHFNSQNRQMAKRFVGKREEASPKDPALEQIDGIKFRKKGFFGQTRSSCPRCGRNFYSEHLKSHIRTHAKPGYRCTWPNCTFFFSQITDAKKHVRLDHLQVEQANSTQTNRYLIKVNPKTGKTTKVSCRPRRQRKEDNSDNSENEEDSSSDDNGDDGDYKELDKANEEDNDNSDQDYAFSDSSSDDSDDDSGNNMEVDNESESLDSIVYSQPSTSYQNSSETNENKSNSSDNKSTNSVNESTDPTRVKCPKCAMTFTVRHKLLLHYRGVHQEWKPYYCRWPKCDFTSAIDDRVITHADRTHFNSQNRQIAKRFVGKREEAPPKNPALEQIDGIKFRKKGFFGQTRSSCPRCGRNFYSEHLKSHIRSHAKPGYRCTWPNCTFFFSQIKDAKKHVRVDHLQVEQANSTETNQYLVKVDPKTGKTTKVGCRPRRQRKEDNSDNSENEEDSSSDENGDDEDYKELDKESEEDNDNSDQDYVFSDSSSDDSDDDSGDNDEDDADHNPNLLNSNLLNDSIQNNDASTNEHINANDQEDDHSRSSTPDYLPRFFDDESGDSSSDDSDDDDLVDDGVDQENECGDNDIDDLVDEDDDDKKLDQKSEHNDDPEYAFLRPSNEIISPTFACPQCKRSMPSQNHLEIHIPSHAKHGFRCTWSECGFFYSKLKSAKEHVCVDHLQVFKINSKYINKHLIKVDPKTGKTTKLGCRPRKLRKVDNSSIALYNSEDEDTSSDDDGSSEM